MQEIRAVGRVGRSVRAAMAYAVLHPERIHGVIAMGACDILGRLISPATATSWFPQKLVAAVFAAYGGRRTSRTCTMPGPCWPTPRS